MIKKLTLITCALISSGMIQAAPIFSESFNTEDDFNRWLVVDSNTDEKTWVFSADALPSKVYYTYHSTNSGDDWLISPSITIPEAGTYMVSYEFAGSSYGEALEVWWGNGQSVDAMKNLGASYPDIKGERQGSYFLFEAPAGDINLGFHAVSAPDKFRLYLCSVGIVSAANPVDLRVSEILSPVTGEGLRQETVTVKVNNDGLVDVDSFDIAFSVDEGDPVVEKVNKTIKIGESLEYTFTAKADLSTPRGKFTIKAWTSHPDDIVPANDAAQISVRHIAPAGIPYFMGFESDEDTSSLTTLNLNNDDAEWHIAIDSFFTKFSRSGSACMGYNYNKENAGDDWFFLDPLEMEKGYYVLKFWYSATENHAERLRVCYGSAPTPEAMTNVLCEYNPLSNETYLESINVFELAESGKTYFGFYCFSDADENWLVIDDISIDRIDNTSLDLMISAINQPGAYLRAANKRDLVFEMRNIGIIDTEATVKISIDGTEVKSMPIEIAKQEIKAVTVKNLFADLAEGTHTYRVAIECDSDNAPANNVAEGTVTILGDAVMLWDMEDGKLPDAFTYRVEDSATVHPDAGDEFNEDGFGVFNLENYLLGTHALAASTWFTDPDKKSDRYIVMPRIRVTGENAHFAWNANSFNPQFRESYSVEVSKSEDAWYNYSAVFSASKIPVNVQTEGIDLSEYNGSDIYVAFHVTTTNGEALILDNMGFYGDVELIQSSITDIAGNAAENITITVIGDTAYAPEGTKAIAVYDLGGRMMVSADGAKVDLSTLAPGFYIARAITPRGTVSTKFSRK